MRIQSIIAFWRGVFTMMFRSLRFAGRVATRSVRHWRRTLVWAGGIGVAWLVWLNVWLFAFSSEFAGRVERYDAFTGRVVITPIDCAGEATGEARRHIVANEFVPPFHIHLGAAHRADTLVRGAQACFRDKGLRVGVLLSPSLISKKPLGDCGCISSVPDQPKETP